MSLTACTQPQCLYSTAITPLPLYAVLPVQSLSARTVQLYLTPPIGHTASTEPQCLYSTVIPLFPYGPYGLYRASVPVQYSYTSTPLLAIRTVLSLNACTVKLYLYSPMGRTACAQPQCLYSKAIPLLPLWTVLPVQSLSVCTVQL